MTRFLSHLGIILICALSVSTQPISAESRAAADLIIHHAHIWTVDSSLPKLRQSQFLAIVLSLSVPTRPLTRGAVLILASQTQKGNDSSQDSTTPTCISSMAGHNWTT